MKPNPSDHRVKAIAAIADILVKEAGDNASGRRVIAEVNRIRQGAEALDNVNARRSPLDTPAAHAMKVAKLARKFDEEVVATFNRIGRICNEGFKDNQRRIDEKINLTPDAFAGEIRATFRTLKTADQENLIKQLIKDNRGPELAALVRAPSILTGIPENHRAVYEQSLISNHAPGALEEQELIGAAMDTAWTAARTAGELARSFTDPAHLAAIESAAAASDAAGEAFNQSLQ